MIVDLFNDNKFEYKARIKNIDKVVVGSGTSIEYAFQIGNFMNSLYNELINNTISTNFSVIIHNLRNCYLVYLNNLYITNCEYPFWYEVKFEDIKTWLDLLSNDLITIKDIKSLSNNDMHLMLQILDRTIKTAMIKYNQLLKLIVETYDDHFEWTAKI